MAYYSLTKWAWARRYRLFATSYSMPPRTEVSRRPSTSHCMLTRGQGHEGRKPYQPCPRIISNPHSRAPTLRFCLPIALMMNHPPRQPPSAPTQQDSQSSESDDEASDVLPKNPPSRSHVDASEEGLLRTTNKKALGYGHGILQTQTQAHPYCDPFGRGDRVEAGETRLFSFEKASAIRNPPPRLRPPPSRIEPQRRPGQYLE